MTTLMDKLISVVRELSSEEQDALAVLWMHDLESTSCPDWLDDERAHRVENAIADPGTVVPWDQVKSQLLERMSRGLAVANGREREAENDEHSFTR